MVRRFDETITTRQRLRELFGEPTHRVANKVIDHVDEICERFIAASPFVLVATRGVDGGLDISPKGDPAGFVSVLDRKTLAIPDRLGNHKFDTVENLFAHPEIALLFLIPGNGDTLRVSGKGSVVRDRALQERLTVNGKAPEMIFIVEVEEAFMHCPKCVVRSRLWKPDAWPDRSNVPTLAEALVTHGRLSESIPEVQTIIDIDAVKRMY